MGVSFDSQMSVVKSLYPLFFFQMRKIDFNEVVCPASDSVAELGSNPSLQRALGYSAGFLLELLSFTGQVLRMGQGG